MFDNTYYHEIRYAATVFGEGDGSPAGWNGSIFRYNYAETYERIRRLTSSLEKLGVEATDRVAF